VKNHLIPHIAKKILMKGIFGALVTLYQCENVNWKMLPKNKLTNSCMNDTKQWPVT
jgi:hypothetical protein